MTSVSTPADASTRRPSRHECIAEAAKVWRNAIEAGQHVIAHQDQGRAAA